MELRKSLVNTNQTHFKHKGVSTIIGTLLLVMISSVGGSTAFVFSQESINSSQISNSPNMEFIEIVGYDARDVDKLFLHDGNEILAKNCCGLEDGKKNYDERISVYLQNNSPEPVIISELRFAGDVYSFTPATKIGEWDKIGNGHKPHPNEYIIVNKHLEGKSYLTLDDFSPTIQPGQIITILLDLGKNGSMYHDYQIKITTNNGNTFVSEIAMGQDKI
ncbi:MAG: hypothetical protein R3237_01020 [Nitrosopumilaceae archaeon]|nr:hypothetical protein [Nitrosopumilaceae archaeon]